MGAFGSKNGLFHDICIRSGLRNGAAIAGLKRGEHLSKEKLSALIRICLFSLGTVLRKKAM